MLPHITQLDLRGLLCGREEQRREGSGQTKGEGRNSQPLIHGSATEVVFQRNLFAGLAEFPPTHPAGMIYAMLLLFKCQHVTVVHLWICLQLHWTVLSLCINSWVVVRGQILHIHTYLFNGLFYNITWVSQHQNNKLTILDFNEMQGDGVAVASDVPYENHFYRATAMLSAVYAVVVCLCVCVSVCLSHSGIVSKRLNLGSRK